MTRARAGGAAASRAAWLAGLPLAVDTAARRWSLSLGTPFTHAQHACAWVAPAWQADGTPVVLKLGLPHYEAEHEGLGLSFWNGRGAVRLVAEDPALGALLIERCAPGWPLSVLDEHHQDVVIAGLLRRLWRRPAAPHTFRPLSAMLARWAEEALAGAAQRRDPGLVRAGLSLFGTLGAPSSGDVLLATDLHAGNVLRARRAPWLAIDPKPFVGDPAYDATQHLLDCPARLRSAPDAAIRRVADLLGVDAQRVRLWLFARLAATTTCAEARGLCSAVQLA